MANVNDTPTGSVAISGTATQNQTLTASNTLGDADGMGTVTYQWLRAGTAITGAKGTSYTLTQADVGQAISVKASYTDGFGKLESKISVATAAVANVNDAPTGGVTIAGTAQQGQVLTASNTLADADGLGAITYQWLRAGTAITEATGASYTLTQADVGKAISVKASYTDGFGTVESMTSATTPMVEGMNHAPTGSVTLSGTPTQRQTLTASNTLADADGMGTVTYQWLRAGVSITGATAATYKLMQADVGKAISVKASYTDGLGHAESVTSAATAGVANVNDAPTGSVTITGTALQGQVLTAASALVDADGLGTLSWQWLRNGEAIDGATGGTYKLTQDDVGQDVAVKVSYTDGFGTAEHVTSVATDPVANVNDAPTGTVLVMGAAVQGQTLLAGAMVDDTDGLGDLSYQWLRGGVAISGATGASYSLSRPMWARPSR